MSKTEKQNIFAKREFVDTPRASEDDKAARNKEIERKRYERRARADLNRNEREFTRNR